MSGRPGTARRCCVRVRLGEVSAFFSRPAGSVQRLAVLLLRPHVRL